MIYSASQTKLTSLEILEKAREIHKIAIEKGFYEESKSCEQIQCLIHEEVSEAFAILRKNPYATSDKIPKFKHFYEEIADIIIRVLDVISLESDPDDTDAVDFNIDENHELFDLSDPDFSMISDLHIKVSMLTRYDDEKEEFVFDLQHLCDLVSHCVNAFGSDIWYVVDAKVLFNKSREYKHGKRF